MTIITTIPSGVDAIVCDDRTGTRRKLLSIYFYQKYGANQKKISRFYLNLVNRIYKYILLSLSICSTELFFTNVTTINNNTNTTRGVATIVLFEHSTETSNKDGGYKTLCNYPKCPLQL